MKKKDVGFFFFFLKLLHVFECKIKKVIKSIIWKIWGYHNLMRIITYKVILSWLLIGFWSRSQAVIIGYYKRRKWPSFIFLNHKVLNNNNKLVLFNGRLLYIQTFKINKVSGVHADVMLLDIYRLCPDNESLSSDFSYVVSNKWEKKKLFKTMSWLDDRDYCKQFDCRRSLFQHVHAYKKTNAQWQRHVK